jgi:hypothetical protein
MDIVLANTYWKLVEDPNWRPYCLACATMQRMTPVQRGFRCQCGVVVGRDMRRIEP